MNNYWCRLEQINSFGIKLNAICEKQRERKKEKGLRNCAAEAKMYYLKEVIKYRTWKLDSVLLEKMIAGNKLRAPEQRKLQTTTRKIMKTRGDEMNRPLVCTVDLVFG